MTVELLDNNSGVLDLTGGSDDNKQEPEGQEQTLDLTDGDQSTDTESDGQGADGDVTDNTDSDGTDSSESDTTDNVEGDESDAEFYFGGQQVQVEVPDEISAALTEAGIDQKELLGQLFKKDGEFSIDDDMRSKLEEKFGKTMVDGYLNMYKGINEQAVSKFAADKQAQEAELEHQGKEYSEAVGGEEGLVKMEDFILKSFDENQLAAYNAVMETGDHQSQMLIISQVKQLMAMTDKAENGDKKVNLVGDSDAAHSGVSTPMDKGYLTYDEYQQLILEDKYWEDSAYMAQVDAARMAGQRKQV